MTRWRAQRGFSLAEALITVAILGMIGMLIFGTFSRAMSARERATEITNRYHTVRQAMLRMSKEISMAFLTWHKDCAEPRTSTIFLGKRAGNGMRLDFTSFSHFIMRADARESDQNELSYFIENDPKDSSRKNLMRREQNRIDEKPTEGGISQVMAEDVESLDFEFYDYKSDQWEDDWDSSGRDLRDRLPKFVSIKLTVKDRSSNKDITFVIKTRVFIKEALNFPGLNFSRCIDN